MDIFYILLSSSSNFLNRGFAESLKFHSRFSSFPSFWGSSSSWCLSASRATNGSGFTCPIGPASPCWSPRPSAPSWPHLWLPSLRRPTTIPTSTGRLTEIWPERNQYIRGKPVEKSLLLKNRLAFGNILVCNSKEQLWLKPVFVPEPQIQCLPVIVARLGVSSLLGPLFPYLFLSE